MKYAYEPEIDDIQKKILSKLIQSETLRFTDMKDEGLENDQFNYHLQTLVKKGYLEKNDSKYKLTIKGKKLVSNFDAKGVVKGLFKVSVALFVVDTKTKKILLQKRTRSPFYGDITNIAGKVLRGEKIIDAAKRKLKEEAGLDGTFVNIGVLRKIKRWKDNEILEDTFYNCCYTENPSGQLVTSNEFGENFWGTFEDAIENSKTNADPGEYEINVLKRVKDKNLDLFYLEDDEIVKNY